MSAITLDQVRDIDCIASFNPLSFDMSGRYVTGAPAVLRRIVYAWFSPRGSLRWALDRGAGIGGLENNDLDARRMIGWQATIEGEARKVDFVHGCRTRLAFRDRTLSITSAIDLADDEQYPLEITIDQAGAAIQIQRGTA